MGTLRRLSVLILLLTGAVLSQADFSNFMPAPTGGGSWLSNIAALNDGMADSTANYYCVIAAGNLSNNGSGPPCFWMVRCYKNPLTGALSVVRVGGPYFLPNASATVTGVNERGDIVGYGWQNDNNGNPVVQGALFWKVGAYSIQGGSDPGYLPTYSAPNVIQASGRSATNARAVSDRYVVGDYTDANGRLCSWYYSSTSSALGSPGGSTPIAANAFSFGSPVSSFLCVDRSCDLAAGQTLDLNGGPAATSIYDIQNNSYTSVPDVYDGFSGTYKHPNIKGIQGGPAFPCLTATLAIGGNRVASASSNAGVQMTEIAGTAGGRYDLYTSSGINASARVCGSYLNTVQQFSGGWYSDSASSGFLSITYLTYDTYSTSCINDVSTYRPVIVGGIVSGLGGGVFW